ncbi:MAG: hypothetical protein IKJ35_04435 [Clostridia bacterium]|nr:hypothetical protein [Clostridia bacterium]
MSEAKTSLPPTAQMNEVEALPQMMLQQVANDVMLRINDVRFANDVCLTAHWANIASLRPTGATSF